MMKPSSCRYRYRKGSAYKICQLSLRDSLSLDSLCHCVSTSHYRYHERPINLLAGSGRSLLPDSQDYYPELFTVGSVVAKSGRFTITRLANSWVVGCRIDQFLGVTLIPW